MGKQTKPDDGPESLYSCLEKGSSLKKILEGFVLFMVKKAQ